METGTHKTSTLDASAPRSESTIEFAARAGGGLASVVGIDLKTRRKHYRGELGTGQIKAAARVAENLFLA